MPSSPTVRETSSLSISSATSVTLTRRFASWAGLSICEGGDGYIEAQWKLVVSNTMPPTNLHVPFDSHVNGCVCMPILT